MIIFNIPGLIMLFISFGIAFGIRELTGTSAEGFTMIVAGPIAAACDLSYRLLRREGHWFSPRGGGSLFFLPVWLFGILWLVLGIIYTVRGERL
jgi:hypothetical protein